MTEYKNKELGLKGDDNILISNVHGAMATYQMTFIQQPVPSNTNHVWFALSKSRIQFESKYANLSKLFSSCKLIKSYCE